MRSSGEGLARAVSLTMAQTFCLAVSITPPMEPEQSMQKTTSMRGLSSAGLMTAAGGGSAARVLEFRNVALQAMAPASRALIVRVMGGPPSKLGMLTST